MSRTVYPAWPQHWKPTNGGGIRVSVEYGSTPPKPYVVSMDGNAYKGTLSK